MTSAPRRQIANNVVYVGSLGDTLFAFDRRGATNCSGTPTTCLPLWTASLAGDVVASPTVANGVVYVVSANGDGDRLYAFDAAGVDGCSGSPKTCTPLWTFDAVANLFGHTESSPTVADGVVYVGFNRQGGMSPTDGALYAFDAAGVIGCEDVTNTCAPLWTAPTDDFGEIVSTPSVADGVVYVTTSAGELRAFDADGITNAAGAPRSASRCGSA